MGAAAMPTLTLVCMVWLLLPTSRWPYHATTGGPLAEQLLASGARVIADADVPAAIAAAKAGQPPPASPSLVSPADLAAVRAIAEGADARAANARQMVLNRDPRLETVEGRQQVLAEQQDRLEGLAAQLGQAIPAADATHAAMNAATTAEVDRAKAAEGALSERLGVVERRVVQVERASVTLPALGVGQTEYQVVWAVPFPDAVYDVRAVVEVTVASLVGKMTAAVKAGSRTRTGCTVVVSASVVVVLGQVLDVTATRYGQPAAG